MTPIMHWRPHLFFKLALPCFLVVFGVFFLGHEAFAQAGASTGSGVADAAITGGSYFVGYIFTIIAQVLSFIAGGLGQISLVLIEMLIVPILNYNSFSTSPIIGLGWSLVRDVMNMGVIIALLFIAIFTIVGNHRAHWEQQIPQLFIAVVFMNFSRTICGILIDISQVVMFTFVNALLDIAAGNFVQLFSMNKFGQYDISQAESAIAAGGNQLLNGSSNLVNAFLQIPLYGSIFAILLLLAIAFLWRIVVLWILVIMSPMAFFLGGVKGIFHEAGGAHSEWWGKFTAALAMGPLLTFFLWLALAAASSGSIVESEHFPTPDTSQTYGLDLTVFRSDNLMGTLLALILLVVGMQQAGSYASKLDGFAKSAINDGMGRKVVGGALRLTSRATGLSAAGYGLSRAGAEGTRQLGGKIISTGSAIGSLEGGGFLGNAVSGMTGRALINAGGYVQHEASGYQKEGKKAAEARIAAMTNDQKAAHFNLIATGKKSSLNINTTDDIHALETDLALNGALRKKTKEAFGKDTVGYNKALDVALAHTESNKSSLDDAQKDKFIKFKTEHLHRLAGTPPADDASPEVKDAYEKKKKDAVKNHVQDDKFNPRDLTKDAVKDKVVREALKDKTVRTTKEGRVTAYDELMRGAYGTDLTKVAVEAGEPPYVPPARAARGPRIVPGQGTPNGTNGGNNGNNNGGGNPGGGPTGPVRPPRGPRGGGGGGNNNGGGNQGGGNQTPPPTGGNPGGGNGGGNAGGLPPGGGNPTPPPTTGGGTTAAQASSTTPIPPNVSPAVSPNAPQTRGRAAAQVLSARPPKPAPAPRRSTTASEPIEVAEARPAIDVDEPPKERKTAADIMAERVPPPRPAPGNEPPQLEA
jgi:hypothetical protein